MANIDELPNSSQSSSQEEKMNIYLKVTKTVAMKVNRSDTIRNVKAAMCVKEGVLENFQETFFEGKCLKDHDNLNDCGVQENSTLHLLLQTSGVVKLNVKVSSLQKNIEFEAKTRDTVQNIKLMIQAKEGSIQSDKYTLLYNGKLLEDRKILASLGIKHEATLNLVFNPRDVVTLSVKLPTGEIVKIEVKILFTVRDVKEIVESMFNFSASDHNLVYNGQQLEESLTLASYKVNEDSILEISPRDFQICVMLWSGKTLMLDVGRHDTVASVKIKILEKIGDPLNFLGRYYLLYAGKCLHDDEDLSRIGVEKQSTLYIKPRFATAIRYMKLSELEGGPRLLPSTSICYLKQIISKKLERPVKEVLLDGKALRDDRTLSYYGLRGNTELAIAV